VVGVVNVTDGALRREAPYLMLYQRDVIASDKWLTVVA